MGRTRGYLKLVLLGVAIAAAAVNVGCSAAARVQVGEPQRDSSHWQNPSNQTEDRSNRR